MLFRSLKNPLSKALHGAHALVTYSSMAALDAFMRGIPIYMNAPQNENSLYHVSSHTFQSIEKPNKEFLDEGLRLTVVRNLALNQWTRAEMKSGQCWAEFKEINNV